jgi:hypothetical protein
VCSVSAPEQLLDRDSETFLLGSVFTACIAFDLRPDHDAARRVLDEFLRLETGWIGSSDLRAVAEAMQEVQRAQGTPVPLAVRDELRKRGFGQAVNALPMLITRSSAVISGYDYYVDRVRQAFERRTAFERHRDAAAELLEASP